MMAHFHLSSCPQATRFELLVGPGRESTTDKARRRRAPASKSSTDCRCRTRGALRGVLGHAEPDGAAALDPGRREVTDRQWEFAWSEFRVGWPARKVSQRSYRIVLTIAVEQ